MKYFADNVSSLYQDLLATVDTIKELEAPYPSSGLTRPTSLAVVRPTTCLLDLCPSWLIKACRVDVWAAMVDIINMSLVSRTFPVGEEGSGLSASKTHHWIKRSYPTTAESQKYPS